MQVLLVIYTLFLDCAISQQTLLSKVQPAEDY